MRLSLRSVAPFALLGAIVIAIAACAPVGPKVCPRVGIHNETSSVTKFAEGGTTEPGNALYRVELTDIQMECKYSGGTRQELEANVTVTVNAERGPKFTGGVGRVQYFVVVTDRAGNVLNKRVFPLRFDLENKRAITFKEATWMYVNLAIQGSGGGAAFEIWTGFQLTEQELQYNRQRASR